MNSKIVISLLNPRCSITIPQDSTNVLELLNANCKNFFSADKKNPSYKWTKVESSTCSWLNISNNYDVVGIPTNEDVGTCEFNTEIRANQDIKTLKTVIEVTNIRPTLSIADTTVLEDSPLVNIRSDAAVQSSEEGHGVYSFNLAETISPKCSDHGSVTVNATTGAVDFDPDLNFQTSCHIAVTFDDRNPPNNIVTKNFLVTVDVTNDAPDIIGSCSTSSTQDVLYTCNALNWVDVDDGDVHTWAFTAANTCSWLSINTTTGVIKGTPNDNQVGTCILAVDVFDGLVHSSVYTNTIATANVAPVFIPAIGNPVNILEDSPATIIRTAAQVHASDEGFGIYTIDNTTTTAPKCSDNGILAINSANGEITFTPAPNYDGACHIKVVFNDQNPINNLVSEEILLTMTAINDKPIITSTCPAAVNELQNYNCTSTFTDQEGSPVTWSKVGTDTCAWATVDPTTGAVTGTPARADVGTCVLAYRAYDGTDYSTTYSRTVTVNNVAPIVNAVDTTLAEDSAATIINTAAQVTSTDEGYGTYSIVAATANDCQAKGTVTIDAGTGALTYAPTANFDTSCRIKIQFNDGKAVSNLGTKEIVVTMIPSPDNATVSIPAGCSLTQNEDIAYTCTPTKTDPDTGDTHTWSINSNTCTWLTLTAATGVMVGTPNDDDVGTCAFTIKAIGNQDGLVSSTLTANITVANVQPTLTGTNPVLILMNAAAANIVDLNSSDETHGVYSLIATSAGGTACSAVQAQAITINSATGVVNFQPAAKFAGLCKINVQFDDQNPLNNTKTFEFNVNVQDFIPPEIEYIDSSTPDGAYILGDTISIEVKFDEEISINTTNGTPRLFLETGAIDRYADFVSLGGVNNDKLLFTYTVQSGDLNADLDVHSTVTTLDLRDSVIKDRFNNTQLNYATPLFPSANSLKARKNLSINGSVAFSTVTGLPTRVSPDLILNATVGGSGVVNYRYKVNDITNGNQSCSNATGYSANIPVATLITDSLVPFVSGTTLRICVLGVNGSGVVTPLAQAFDYIWTKDLFSISKVSFASVTNLANWQDSEVDPDNNNIIYAKNLLGEIYKSTDFGTSFKHFCSIPPAYNSSMEVSPGPDRTPYIFQNSRAYRIDDMSGGNCPDLYANGGFTKSVVTDYAVKNYDFTANGDLYVGFIDTTNFKIYRSFNQGTSWSLFSTTPTLGMNGISFTIHPTNPQKIIYNLYEYMFPVIPGIYLSTDAGVTKTQIQGGAFATAVDFKWDLYNTSYVFSGINANNHKSTNQGTTWAADNPGVSFPSSNLILGVWGYNQARWDIDKVTGSAYRMRSDANNSYLQKSTDLFTGGVTTWTTIYTFPDFGYYDAGLNVSVSGNSVTPTSPTIAINIKNRLLVSTDGGVSFTEIYTPKELKFASITSFGDGAIYGATKDWAVIKTTDNGKNWAYKQFDYSQCLGVSPRISVNREDNQKVLMWAENYGTINCNNFNYSIDGMNSLVSRDSFSFVAPKLQVSMSINDAKNFYIFGKPVSGFAVNTTENNAFENLSKPLPGLEFTSPMPDSFISPIDKNKAWIVDNVSTGILYEYDILNSTRTDLSSNTGLTSIAGMDSYIADNGEYGLRLMDRTGKIRVSKDFGATYADEGAASGVLTSCNIRFLYHHPKDKTLLLTACLNSNLFSYSKDSGNTWTQINTLTKFNINCNLNGIALSSSKIFLACTSADTFELNYTSVENINAANDNILTVAEQAAGLDLINHLYPATYTIIKYAVIADGDVCDATTPGLSTTVPKSNDPFFTSRGGYRICIEQKDSSNAFTYTTSTVIFYDNSLPIFTSIDLINDAADGKITYIESFNFTSIVGNLVSSNHDFVKYAVVPVAATCDGSLTYSYQQPQSQNDAIKIAGTYKVCVQLTTKGNLTPVYGSSASFVFEPTTVLAQILNPPTDFISQDSSLSVTIAGNTVTDYKYKIIPLAKSCHSSTGYSASTPIATLITSSLTGYINGTHLKLCVIGADASGNWQSYEKATEHYWIKSTGLISSKIDFSGANTMSSWRDVSVHQVNSQKIYAINDMGEIYKSDNAGANWKIMCRVNNYLDDMQLQLSPGDDATAYVIHVKKDYRFQYYGTSLFRVDSLNGQPCVDILSNFNGLSVSTYYHSPVSISTTGALFYAETQYNSVVIRRSLDFGKSWSFVGQIQNGGTQAGLFINPTDPNYMLLTTVSDNSPATQKGLSRSIDGGKTWTFITSAFFNTETFIFFDPINAGRVYTNNGRFSTDYGATWNTDLNLPSSITRRWFVDSTGNGYQSTQTLGTTYIKKSTGMSPANFVNVKSFLTGGLDLHATVSASGTTIAVIANKQLHISTDSGTSFTQIYWPGKYLSLSGIDSSNGFNQYAVANGWNVFASTNQGSTWNYKTQYYNSYCFSWNGANSNFARIMAHPLFPETAYVFGTVCQPSTISTNDGFNTSLIVPQATVDYTRFSIAPFATDASKVEKVNTSFGAGLKQTSLLSTDLFATASSSQFSLTESLVNSNSPYGVSYLGTENATLYIDNSNLVESRRDQKIISNITNRLTFAIPAAIRLTADQNDLAYKYIVISNNGVLNQSKDNGLTYQQIGTSIPGITTCSNRILATYPNDNNLMATACYGGNDIAWTENGGVSWQQYRLLTDYNMNCSLSGITISNAKISFSCEINFEGLYFYHTPVILENLASDNILLPGENDGQNLVSIYNASKYVTINYSIISAGGICSGATPGFSTTIPKGSDLIASGNYQVCSKLFDGTSTTYASSSVIHYSTATPTFTSIDLTLPLGVHLINIISTPVNLVNNLVATNYEKPFYALVDSATTCNDSITYSEVIPTSQSPLFVTPGNYKVCIALANQSGQKTYGSSSAFEFSRAAVLAKLSNYPEGVSSITNLNINVLGAGVDQYKYKVGAAAWTNCKVAAGYSGAISNTTPITDDISAIPNGNITLCVLGLSDVGKNQLPTQPTFHTWSKNSINLATHNLGISSHVDEWHDIVVTKGTTPRIYASTKRGRIFLSTNRGSSWVFQCQVPYDTNSKLVASNAPTALAFISSGGEIYRIDQVPMPGACPSVTSGIGTIVSNFKRLPLVINSKNELYLVEEVNATTSKLYFSIDRGETWSLKQTLSSIGTSINLFIDPLEDKNIQFTFVGASNVINVSQNAGLSLEIINASSTLPPPTSIDFLKDPNIELKFDPINFGSIYTNNNYYSLDYGETWLDSQGFNNNLIRWDMANDTVSYRLKQNGANVSVETATTPHSTASVFKTINGLTLDGKETISVSGNAATIAAIILNKAFISLDGANFTQIYSPDTTHMLASVTSEDGATLYGVDFNWNFYKSLDGGVNSNFMTTYNSACTNTPRLKTSKNNSNFVYAWSYNASINTGCSQNMYSTNGLTTPNFTNTSFASPAPIVALNQANSAQFSFLGHTAYNLSTNSGAAVNSTALPNETLTSQNPDAVMSSTSSDFTWYIPSSNKLIEADRGLVSKTDITSKLTFATPAGLEGFGDGSLEIISRTGEINISNDQGLTFTSLTSNPGLHSCQNRLMRTLSTDANIKASTCFRSSYVSYTKDGGTTWTEINLATYGLSSTCTINDIALVSQGATKKIAIACEGLESLLFNID